MSVVLACDIGATSLRAALVDRTGHVTRVHRRSAPTEHEHDGMCDIDPAVWWSNFCELADALAADAGRDFAKVEAVAVCGVTRTQVILDRAGAPLRPAMSWSDTRADALVERLVASLPQAHPERPRINAFHPLARLAWLKAQEPRALEAAAAVLDPKDYVNFRLTGRIATDPISSARLIAAAAPGPDGETLFGAAGIPQDIVPLRLAPTEVVGQISAGLNSALAQLVGRPVFCLANDTWAAVLGLGALRSGYAYNISGTTDVIGVVSETPASAPGLMPVDWGTGLHHLGGPSQNGADTLAWLVGLFEEGEAEASAIGPAVERLLSSPRDAQPILFLPYLKGERTPHWDPALRGAALGLNRRHTRTDLCWAVLESIAFLSRRVLESAEAALSAPVREIRFGGGGAANATWCQIKADICERPVVVGAAPEPGLLGCAIAARVGLDQYPSLEAAQEALVRVAHRYQPRIEHRAAYRKLYEIYRSAEAALCPLSHALSALDGRRDPLPGIGAASTREAVPQ